VKRLWVIEFVANAVLLFALYEWLGIRDSRISQIVLSFVLIVAMAAGAVWLHSRTFSMKPLRLAFLAFFFLMFCWGLSTIPFDRISLWIASTLTLRLRRPVNPVTVGTVLNCARWFVQWIAVPLILLQRKDRIFWLQYTGVIVGAFLLPGLLIHWVPRLNPTAAQVASFVARFGLAYCLAITGFVALSWFTSRKVS
jgi:hypothetical protein